MSHRSLTMWTLDNCQMRVIYKIGYGWIIYILREDDLDK